MPIPQGVRPARGRVTVRVMPMHVGAASSALRDVLSGPPRTARVLGVHPSCVYLLAGSELVALEAFPAGALPRRPPAPASGASAGDPNYADDVVELNVRPSLVQSAPFAR